MSPSTLRAETTPATEESQAGTKHEVNGAAGHSAQERQAVQSTPPTQSEMNNNGRVDKSKKAATLPGAGSAGANKAVNTDSTASTASTADRPLSNAELKKQAKAEKAARRAQTVGQKQDTIVAAQSAAGTSTTAPSSNPAGQTETTRTTGQLRRRTGSNTVDRRQMTIRPGSAQQVPIAQVAPVVEDKTVEFYRHLYRPRATSILGASKEVHPAVLALGLRMGNYTVCGSCARLVATLQAFKKVIQSYTTPAGNTLTRHLTSHVLSPQIEFLAFCRPISISMGNAIRWLKLEISKVDIDLPDIEAKKDLCDAIDSFLRDRVTFADQVISTSAADKVEDGDVILTFAKSSIVQTSLVKAKQNGKRFRVIVVDSRPLHEGKHLANALVQVGIEVKYCLLNGLAHCVGDATKVFLGAHAMLSNGRLFSRVGTALVAVEANQVDKPVIVLCETIKFTERVALDSIAHNEVAPPDELIIEGGPLEKWKDVKGLQLCNIMYDVTPAEYIQMIISESGNVPPTSVPVLHRLGNEGQ